MLNELIEFALKSALENNATKDKVNKKNKIIDIDKNIYSDINSLLKL